MPTGNDTFPAGIYMRRIDSDGKKHGKHTIARPAPLHERRRGRLSDSDRPVRSSRQTVPSNHYALCEPHMLRDIRSLIAVFRRLTMPINGVMPSKQIHRRGTEQTGLD